MGGEREGEGEGEYLGWLGPSLRKMEPREPEPEPRVGRGRGGSGSGSGSGRGAGGSCVPNFSHRSRL